MEIGYFLFHEGKKYITYDYMIIMPSYQNHGIGYYISEWVFARADKVQKPVIAQVLKNNRGALRLWLRLGFVIVGETKTHFNLASKNFLKK